MRKERKQARVTKRLKRGRPSQVRKDARSKRVVTFVTARESECLEQIACEEDRSLSAIVHRIIEHHLERIDLSKTQSERSKK